MTKEKYNYMDIVSSKTKKSLLKRVLKHFNLKETEYTAFFIWSKRLRDEIPFEDKFDLYIRFRILDKEIYDSKKDKYRTRKERE